ncbi:MAG: Ig-like domain-containing protein [Solimonas sp.]
MKAVRLLAALAALALAACGDGSVKSPDFEAELQSIAVTPVSATLALGQTQQFTATGTFTTPPGQTGGNTADLSSSVSWVSDNTAVATIDAGGKLTSVAQGTVHVTASKGGITSNQATVTIGAPILVSVAVFTVVDGETTGSNAASIALGATQDFKVLGVYTNATTPRELDLTTASVVWASGTPATATVAPTTGVITTATSVAVGSTTITATVTDSAQPSHAPFVGTGTLTVTNATLSSVLRLAPSTGSVAIGKTLPFQAIGRYSDNTEAAIDNSQLDWTTATPATATIDTSGVATGVALGSTAVTATLKASVPISGTVRSASGTLSVTNASCLNALLADDGATATVAASGLCLGCIVDDENKIIDTDSTNFANMVASVGLLGGNVSVTVKAADGVTFPATETAHRITGFVIGRPANQLLSAELLSQLQVSTVLAGTVQETSSSLNVLRLTLLGLLGSNAQALLTMEATKPYDAIRLTFNSGVLTALSSTQVYSACSLAEVPAD